MKYLYLLLMLAFINGCASRPTSPALGEEYADLMDSAPSEVLMGMVPKSYKKAIKRGDDALVAGELDKALFMYLQSLGQEGDAVYPLFQVGLIHQQRDNRDLSILAYTKVLELDDLHYLAHENLGILYLKNRRYELSAQELSRAIEVYDELRDLAAKAAANSVKNNGRQEPVRDTSIAPVRSFNGLGVIYDLQENFEQAQVYYRKIISLQRYSESAYNNLGYSYYLSGDWSNAEKSYREAIKINDKFVQAWNNLGLVLARQAKFKQSVLAFSHGMDKARAYNDVGYLAMVDGRHEQAEMLLSEAIRLFPRFYETAQKNYDDNQAQWADVREASANKPIE